MTEKTESNRLQEWYAEFIDKFREEYAKLTEEEKKNLHKTNDYYSKCQIEIFWLKRPEWQLIVRTHFEDRPDAEIIINGPFDSTVFQDEVKAIINNPRWNRPIYNENNSYRSSNSPRLYSEHLASDLHHFIDMAKNALFSKFRLQGLSRTYTNNQFRIEHYFGNIADNDHDILIKKIIQETKQRIEYDAKLQNQPESQTPLTKESFNGFGAYFFPPMIIGEIQRPSPSDILEGNTSINFPTFDKKAFDIKFAQTTIIITKDGYVGVCTDNKEKSLEILNTIMATCTLNGVEVTAVREHELSQISYNSETHVITGYHYDMQTVRSQLFNGIPEDKILEHRVKEIPEDQIKNIIKIAAEIFKNELISEEIRTLLESINHLKGNEFSQAFMMGWIIIERHISQLWDCYLKEKEFDKKRVEKLQNTGQWSTDQWIEVLNLVGYIKNNDHSVYMDLKKKRNNLMHYGKKINKEDAEECVNVAKEIILNKISELERII